MTGLRNLPANMQEDIARMVLQAVGDEQSVIRLSADEDASFDESLAQESRGEFAEEAQISHIWAKHGL